MQNQPPDTSLKKLDAYWKAKLGKLYGRFFVAPGVRWPSEFTEDGVWDPLPPKKPAGSVRFAEVERLKKAIGAEWEFRAGPNSVTGPSSMAATASAYLSPDELKSAKSAPPELPPLVRRIDGSRLPPNLAWTARCFVVASQQGPVFYASTFAVSIESRRSYRTVQRHFDELERLEVLKKKHEANTFVPGYGMRRTASYTLHENAGRYLMPSEDYAQWRERNRRNAPNRKHPQRDSAQHKRETSPPAPTPIAPPVEPAPKPMGRRDTAKLVALVVGLKHGSTDFIEPLGGLKVRLYPGDPRYRAPVDEATALQEACDRFNISVEAAKRSIQFHGFRLSKGESP
jgi:hypothetical protein